MLTLRQTSLFPCPPIPVRRKHLCCCTVGNKIALFTLAMVPSRPVNRRLGLLGTSQCLFSAELDNKYVTVRKRLWLFRFQSCGRSYIHSSFSAREISSSIVSITISRASTLSNLQIVLWFAGSSKETSICPGRFRKADDLSTIFETKMCQQMILHLDVRQGEWRSLFVHHVDAGEGHPS